MKIINRVLESAKSIKVPIREPLNEIFFNKHPMLRMVEKIFSQWQTIARTQGYDGFKKAVNNGTALKKILMDLFGFSKIEFMVSDNTTENNMATMSLILRPQLSSTYTQKIRDLMDKFNSDYKAFNMPSPPPSKEDFDSDLDYLNAQSNYLDLEWQAETAYWKQRTQDIEAYARLLQTKLNNDLENKRRSVIISPFRAKTDSILDTGRPLSDVNQFIIQDKDGIRFDRNQIKITSTIEFYYYSFIHKAITPEMLTAVLLHEIGHNFAQFVLTPPVRVYPNGSTTVNSMYQTRANESFADQFATMYGYGLSAVKDEILNSPLLTPHNRNKIRTKGSDLDEYNQMLKKAQDRQELDVHPATKMRIYNMINQMKMDLKDPYLTPQKRQSLLAILKQTKKYLKQFKKKDALIDRMMTDLAKLDAEYSSRQIHGFANPLERKTHSPRILRRSLKNIINSDSPRE